MISKKETIEYYVFHGKKNVKVQVYRITLVQLSSL
jgi:hypothetical protein